MSLTKAPIALLLLFAELITGCATARKSGTEPLRQPDRPQESEASEPSPDEPTVSSLTLENNESVAAWISYFTQKDRDRFQRFLDRGSKYRKIIENLLLEHELPSELYFLALIESGYQNHATSRASAAGVWQFISGTAKRYGLTINREVDERRDPIRSTEAAARYLRDLYNIFGSWPLAMAAYNAGEYGIIRAIMKGKSRDYWQLREQKALPRETAEYVPKIFAAALIGADPEKYGFKLESAESFPELDALEVPSPVRVADLARTSGVGLDRLREFNPHLKGEWTPDHATTYEIWLPKPSKSDEAQLRQSLAALQRRPRATSRSLAQSIAPKNLHQVKPGENLSQIARRYGVSVNFLMKVNRLSSRKILAGTSLRITSRAYQPQEVHRYQVKKGESLEKIARMFGLTVSRLKDLNDLERSRIYPGQILLVKKEKK